MTGPDQRSDPPGSKILVVEDDTVMASAIERLLRRFGHVCTSAVSAEGALETLDVAPFDLMVTDVNLGTGGSGLDLVAAAKSGDPDLAVLMVSGLDDPDTADAALDLGAFGYIIKPFAMNELRIGVSNALRRRELEVAQRSHLARLESEVRRRTAELQAVSDDLRARESRFRSLATATPLGVVYVRLDGSCEYANRSAEVLLGCLSGELDQHSWLAGVDPTDRESIEQSIRGAHSGVPGSDHEHRYERPDGSRTWLRTHIAPVADDQGGISGVLALLEDIETRRRLEIRLREQAMHDHLTGLPNRRFLREHLTERLASVGGDRIGLFMVDLDQFKLVNDTYGHETGDELIVAMARRLSEWAGEDRVVARLGGDEFVVICQGPSRDGMLEDAESLHRAVSAPMTLATVELNLSASIGVALQPDAGPTASDLLRGADVSLHKAKERRNAIEVFDARMAQGISRRLAVGSELRRAIEDHSLGVHFQPIVDARGDGLTGLEALARWTHPGLGPVSPGEFIPVAESAGIAHLVDARILTQAVDQLVRWRRLGRVGADCFVSVNVSGGQLANRALAADVSAALRRSGLPAQNLCVEVTENALAADLDRAIPVLDDLRRLGVRIAIDDFGTGHSSLACLQRLPLDFLKIDRAFVSDLGSVSEGGGIVDVIIDIAHRAGLRTIAEGVEDGRQLARLRELGCDMVQGYLLGRPGPAEDSPPGAGAPAPRPARHHGARPTRPEPHTSTRIESAQR